MKLARTKWPRQGGKKISLTFDERIVRVVIAKYTSDEVIGTLHKQIGFWSIGHTASGTSGGVNAFRTLALVDYFPAAFN